MIIVLIFILAAVIAVMLWVSRSRTSQIDYPVAKLSPEDLDIEGPKKSILLVTSNDDHSISQYTLPIMAAICETRGYDFKVASNRFDYAIEHLKDYQVIVVVSNRVVFNSAYVDLSELMSEKIGAAESCTQSFFCDNILRTAATGDFDELIRTVYSPDILVVNTSHPSAKNTLLKSRDGYPPDDDSIQPMPASFVAFTTAAYGLVSGTAKYATVCDRADTAREYAMRVKPVTGDFKDWRDLIK